VAASAEPWIVRVTEPATCAYAMHVCAPSLCALPDPHAADAAEAPPQANVASPGGAAPAAASQGRRATAAASDKGKAPGAAGGSDATAPPPATGMGAENGGEEGEEEGGATMHEFMALLWDRLVAEEGPVMRQLTGTGTTTGIAPVRFQ
jgi:hypothetical protein